MDEPTTGMLISPKAVVTGVAVDFVLTNLLVLPVAIGLAARPEIQAAPAAEQGVAIVAALEADPWAYAASLALGSLASCYGGWVAAGVAKRSARLHSGLSAVGCAVFGLDAWAKGLGQMSTIAHAGFLLLAPALGVLGGAMRARRDQSIAARAQSDVPEVSGALVGWKRGLLMVDRAVLVLSLLAVILFVSLAMFGRLAAEAKLGVGLIIGYATIVAASFLVAARALQQEHPFLKRLHVLGFGLLAMPVAAVATWWGTA